MEKFIEDIKLNELRNLRNEFICKKCAKFPRPGTKLCICTYCKCVICGPCSQCNPCPVCKSTNQSYLFEPLLTKLSMVSAIISRNK